MLVLTAFVERLAVGQGVVAGLLAAGWGVPLLARARFRLFAPSSTLVLIGATLVLAPDLGRDTAAQFVLMLTCVWLLFAHNSPQRALWGLPAVAVAFAGLMDSLEELVLGAVLAAGAAAAGVVYRRDRLASESLHDHVAQLEQDRGSALQAAAADERARIARELHDIVAHSVSVMTVQSGAARLQLPSDPAQALASIQVVEEATNGALAELDRLVGLLGFADTGTDEPTRVECGLADAGPLVGRMTRAGLDARLSVEGELRPLAPGLDLALYRVLQEALTNALKHGGPVKTDVRVRYAPDAVGIEVASDLPAGSLVDAMAAGGDVGVAEGHGLVGMRERVAMYGGSVAVGPYGGRFRVNVQVPTP